MSTPTRKTLIAKQVLKAQRDTHFKRIDHATSQNRIKDLMDEAKLHNLCPNAILCDIMNNEAQYEQALEKQYHTRYGINNTSII